MALVRLAELDRPEVGFVLDGAEARALEGDTLLTAILLIDGWVRASEFGDGARAGFCWMGACQDCTLWIEGAGHRRACTTPVVHGMRVRRLGTVGSGTAGPGPTASGTAAGTGTAAGSLP